MTRRAYRPYEQPNRPRTKTPPTGPVISYTYDLAGRLKSASDNSSAIPSAVSPTGSPVAYITNLTYDAMNRPTTTTWDQVNTAAAPGAASSVLFTHSYNKANQRSGQSVSDNTWINYPAAVDTTTNYTANALNQYATISKVVPLPVVTVTPTYDTNGNLTSDGTYTLGYDAENRLVSAAGAGNTASYTFDAQGRRKTRTVNGTTTVSVTDAQNREVLEYNGSTGALLRWYAYGIGPNTVLGQMNVPANTRTTPIPDLLGSIVGSMDADTGTLTKFAYRPFGASAAAPTPFGYTGQRIDLEAGGIYYYRARAYSPVLGRFLQPDPIGYKGGLNLYAYVENNPLNLIDPSGLSARQAVQQAALLAAQQAAQQVVAQANAARSAASGSGNTAQASRGIQLACFPACAAPAIPSVLEALGAAASALIVGIGLGQAIDTSRDSDPVVYHKVETTTQTPETAAMQQRSGEIWGKEPRLGGLGPSVNAYVGPLPAGARGIEFTTSIPPGSALPFPGGLARWYGDRQPGVSINDQGFAVLPVTILKNTQVLP